MAQKRLIKRYVGYGGNYYFPLEQKSTNNNFANLKTRTSPLAGFDGGYDELGDRRGQQEIGTIQINAKLIDTGEKSTWQLAKEWRAMAGWGPQRLFVIPLDTTDEVRKLIWSYTRVTYATPNFDSSDQPDVYLDATISFNVPDPAWYGIEPSASEPAYNASGITYMDDEGFLDGTNLWGGPRVTATVSGGGTFAATNSGTRVTRPVIRITAASTMSSFGLRRYDPFGNAADEWRYTGTLAAGERLVLDCQTYSVTREDINGDTPALADFVFVKGLGFHELLPGTTTFEMVGTVTDAVVNVEYFDSWY